MFLLCDLSTVQVSDGASQDLISYAIEQTEPLKIKECAIGAGKFTTRPLSAHCGSLHG
jgi:hypothetical protein